MRETRSSSSTLRVSRRSFPSPSPCKVSSRLKTAVSASYLDTTIAIVNGDVTISADTLVTTTALNRGLTLALGLSLAVQGLDAQTDIDIDNTARTADTSSIDARDVTISARATPSASASTEAATGGAIGVGVSNVDTDVNVLSTATTLNTGFTVRDLTVSADEARASANADTAYSSAQGIVGALIGVDATVTHSDHIGEVTALLGAGTTIIASGTVAATARGDNRQRAYSDSAACGLVAAGATKAYATSTSNTKATVGDGVTITAGDMVLGANRNDDNLS